MIAASQAIFRTVSGASSSPVSVVPAPVRSTRSARFIVTTTAALAVAGADPPAAAARRQTSTSASARRWSLVRRSEPCSVEGCGAASGPRIASSTADPSGSSRSRYSAIPSSSNGWDRAVPCLSRSSRRWNSPRWPYLAINAGRSARISRGPCPSASATNPSSTVPWHSGVNRRPELVHLPDRDRGVADRRPRGQHRLAQHPVALLGDRHGDLHQGGRTAGEVGVAPVPHPPGR